MVEPTVAPESTQALEPILVAQEQLRQLALCEKNIEDIDRQAAIFNERIEMWRKAQVRRSESWRMLLLGQLRIYAESHLKGRAKTVTLPGANLSFRSGREGASVAQEQLLEWYLQGRDGVKGGMPQYLVDTIEGMELIVEKKKWVVSIRAITAALADGKLPPELSRFTCALPSTESFTVNILDRDSLIGQPALVVLPVMDPQADESSEGGDTHG